MVDGAKLMSCHKGYVGNQEQSDSILLFDYCHASYLKPMDPLNIAYFHFTWVLKLPTSHNCHGSHPVKMLVQTTPMFFNGHSFWPMVVSTDQGKSCTARIEGPTGPEDCFVSYP